MGETSAERARRILRDWAGVVPRQDESASVQQRIVGDVTGLAGDVLALGADAAALREVIFSLDYALRQWERHGPPPEYDVHASFRDLRALIDQARERALLSR